MLLADTIFWRRNCKQNCTFRIYTLSCAPLRFGLLRLISTGARLGTIQHAHKKRLFPFEHSLLCVAQCVRSCVKVAWQRNSALTWHKLVVTWCKLSTISVFAEKQVLYNGCVWKKQSTVAFEHISAFQAPANKPVNLSANRDLLKVPPSQIIYSNNCPYLQIVESFWNLVRKDRFPKLQDFALKMHSIFGSTHVRKNTFSIGYFQQFFFKENVMYPVWICRDPISLILGIRFEILGTRIGSLKRLEKALLSSK